MLAVCGEQTSVFPSLERVVEFEQCRDAHDDRDLAKAIGPDKQAGDAEKKSIEGGWVPFDVSDCSP